MNNVGKFLSTTKQHSRHSWAAYSRWFVMVLVFLICYPTFASQLSSTVDRTEISEDESLTLRVRYDGNTNGQPDFSALSQDFEILSQQQSNQIRTINGRVEAFTEWSMMITPRTTGVLQIPSFEFDGERSAAVKINVTESAPLPAGKKDVVFLETVVDHTTTYVQEQITVTYRFFYSVNVEALDRPDLALDDVVIEPLDDTSYQRKINGTPYNVAEFNYALFPQTSGPITIPSMRWTAKINYSPRRSMFDLHGGRYEIKRLQTDQILLNVRAKPDSFPSGATWLPSPDVTLEDKWNKDPGKFKVGEPITRTLTLRASGLMSSQLPKLLPEVADERLKFYPDQPAHFEEKTAQGITATRTETVAVVVSEGGEIVIPKVRIPWWDTKKDELRYAEIPERRVVVAASEAMKKAQAAREQALAQGDTSSLPTAAQPAVSHDTIPQWLVWLSVLAGLLALVFLSLWIYTLTLLRKLTRPATQGQSVTRQLSQSESKAWAAFQRACAKSDLADVRKTLIHWAKIHWPMTSIHALADVHRQLGSADVEKELQNLDKALFSESGNSHWQAASLLQAMEDAKKSHERKEKSTSALVPLYGQ